MRNISEIIEDLFRHASFTATQLWEIGRILKSIVAGQDMAKEKWDILVEKNWSGHSDSDDLCARDKEKWNDFVVGEHVDHHDLVFVFETNRWVFDPIRLSATFAECLSPDRRSIEHWIAQVLRFHGIGYVEDDSQRGWCAVPGLIHLEQDEVPCCHIRVPIEECIVVRFVLDEVAAILSKVKGSSSGEMDVLYASVVPDVSSGLKAKCWIPATSKQSALMERLQTDLVGCIYVEEHGDIDDFIDAEVEQDNPDDVINPDIESDTTVV